VRVLAFDTCLAACSAALLADGVVRALRQEVLGRGHAERLLPMLAAVLGDAGLRPGQIDLLAVTAGPGSFVGVRVGVAAARGLALALDRPAIGVGTLAALAGEPSERAVLAAIEAGSEAVYAQAFAADRQALGPPRLCAAEEAAGLAPVGCALAGNAGSLVLPWLARAGKPTAGPIGAPHPDPCLVARLAMAALAAGARGPPAPLYLRPSDARLPAA